MAKLTTCKACGKEVSTSAKKCPHCGHRLKMGFFRKALLGIGALIVLGIIIGIASGGGDDTADKGTSTSTPKQEANKPLSNEGVSSDVNIKVTGVESKSEVGGQFSKEKAQGVFKIVNLAVTNNQKDAITLDATSFKLLDDKNREFSHSVEGQTALEMEDSSLQNFFLKQLNPGLTQNGKIVFDVPTDAKGLKLKARGGFTGDEIILKAE
jgi:hypothetical protein